MPLRDTPIKRKLMLILMLTSSVVLLLTCGSFVGYELLTYKDRAKQSLTTLGEVIASNSTAALAFDNDSNASEVLSALKARPQIVAAAIMTVRASYSRNIPPTAPSPNFRLLPTAMAFGTKAHASWVTCPSCKATTPGSAHSTSHRQSRRRTIASRAMHGSPQP